MREHVNTHTFKDRYPDELWIPRLTGIRYSCLSSVLVYGYFICHTFLRACSKEGRQGFGGHMLFCNDSSSDLVSSRSLVP